MITTRSRRTQDEADGARSAHAPSAVPARERPASPPSVFLGDARRRQWVLSALAIAAAVGLTAALAAADEGDVTWIEAPPSCAAAGASPRHQDRCWAAQLARAHALTSGVRHLPRPVLRVEHHTAGGRFAARGARARRPGDGRDERRPRDAGQATSAVDVHGSLFVVLSSETPKVCLVDPSHAWTRPR